MLNDLNTAELRTLAIAGLRAEIDRLKGLLVRLEGSQEAPVASSPSSPRAPRRAAKRAWTAAQRRKQSEMMRKRWAAKRKGS